MRVCKKCGIEKDLDEFKRDDRIKSGRSYSCKDCIRKRSRQWQRDNKDKVKLYQKRYQEKNEERVRVSWSKARDRRRNMSKNTEHSLTDSEWKYVLNHFSNSCAVCESTNYVQLDHFVPIASGNGDTSIGNVIPLCRKHNINKRDKDPVAWLVNESGADSESIDKILSHLAVFNGMEKDEYRQHAIDLYYGIETFVKDERETIIERSYYVEEGIYFDEENAYLDSDRMYESLIDSPYYLERMEDDLIDE